MKYTNRLKTISFSNGIHSQEIEENFSNLAKQIAQERLAIGGSGISQGLDLTIKGNKLFISQGVLVDMLGEEISFDETSFILSPPKLQKKTEEVIIDSSNIIKLNGIPYSDYLTPCEYIPVENLNISIHPKINTGQIIDIVSTSKNLIYINSSATRNSNLSAIVTYYITGIRYDVIYIDDNYTLKKIEGMTSTSPSYPEILNARYILGYVEVNAFVKNHELPTEQAKKRETEFFNMVQNSDLPLDIDFPEISAGVFIKKGVRNLRKIFTDTNGRLYIDGIPFDQFQIIHRQEPTENIQEDTFWYDTTTNILKIWKTVGGISSWQNVNDTSFIPVTEKKLWKPEDNPEDKQSFKFDLFNEQNLRFIPRTNALEVTVDNVPLMSDQFIEIIEEDDPVDDSRHLNKGIGFKLIEPLNKNAHVEVKITQRINDNTSHSRFQKTTTFIHTEDIVYNEIDNPTKVFYTEIPYLYDENQLEVFLEGKRLIKDKNYIEGSDLEDPQKIRGSKSMAFKISSDIINGDSISYKITTNIYSYSNLGDAFNEVINKVNSIEDISQSIVQETENFNIQTTSRVNNLSGLITSVIGEHDMFLKKTDKIQYSNLPEDLNQGLITNTFYKTITKTGTLTPIEGITPTDYTTAFYIDDTNGHILLLRGIDYDITQSSDGSILLNFLTNPKAIPNDSTIYISGINIGH